MISHTKQEYKKELGHKLLSLRKTSMRKMAKNIGLSPSNLKYIEEGINAPTSDIYKKLINELKPTNENRDELDKLYSCVRGTPPPDVCEIIISNPKLNELIRYVGNNDVSTEKIEKTLKVICDSKGGKNNE